MLQSAAVSSTGIGVSIPVQGIHFDGVTTHYADADDTASSNVVVTSGATQIVSNGSISLGGASAAASNSTFDIVINYSGDAAYASYFQAAAARWSQIITADIPDAIYNGVVVDDLVIDAQVSFIDGGGSGGRNILGQAGPDYVRLPSYLPIHGIMTFDSYDLASMASQGILDEVIMHEMGHVLGIGTIWSYVGLRTGDASYWGFTGANALAEYKAMSGNYSATSVPVQPGNIGGSSGVHWAESVFQNELMTPMIGPGNVMPISRLTIASLTDLGYTVNLNAADAYTFPGATGAGMVRISDVSISEGNSGTQLATLTVTRTGGSAAFSVNYATSDGTALAGPDYTGKSGTLTFAAGVNTQTITVSIKGDAVPEANENFFVNLYGATGGAAIADSQGVGTIVNDDVGAGSISISNAAVVEGDGGTQFATFTVTRTGGSEAFSVNYATGNYTALAGSDYVAKSGTLDFAAGVNSQTITVAVNGDVSIENNEYFYAYLSGATNNGVVVNGQGLGTIVNDDNGLVSIDDVTIQEGDNGTRTALFTVTRTGSQAAFSVNFATADSTASAASDYVATSGTLNFGTGETSKTISVTINGDPNLEDNEAFFVNLTGATNGATIADGKGQGTIVNDDVSNPLPDDFADSLTDLTAAVGQLSVGGSVTGNLEKAGDRDWFRLTVATVQDVTVQVQGLDSAQGTLVDPYLYIYNGAGVLQLTGDNTGRGLDSQVVFYTQPLYGTTYYIAAGAFGDSYAGTYRINVFSGFPEYDDRPDSLADKSSDFGVIQVGPTYGGTLETAGDRDWWVINLTAGVNYQLTLSGRGYLSDTYLRLHDGTGALITENNDINPGVNVGSQLVFRPAVSGTYYLEAAAFNDASGGPFDWYDLQASIIPNNAPLVTLPSGNSLTVSAVRQSIAFGTLFNVTDADNEPLTYYLYDDNAAADSGYWMVAGVVVPARTIYQVTEDQLAQTNFVAGARGGSDNVYLQAYDGHVYSGWTNYVRVGVPVQLNNAPTVSRPAGASVTASAPGQSFQFSSLFAGNDADQDPLTYYLYDSNAAAGSGRWVVNGTVVAAGTIHQVSAAQLAQTTFVAGTAGTADAIYVQAFDGIAYSGWNTSVHVAGPAPNHVPTVNRPAGASMNATAAQSLAVSSLFSGSDSDGDALSYYLYDSNPAANSGHFVVNGVTVPAQSIYALTAAQLAQATFVTGAAGTSDSVYVQAFDGKAYSGWNTSVHVAVPVPNNAPTVSLPSGASVNAAAGQPIAVSNLFSGSDLDGDTLSYYLYDYNAAANSGHFEVNGVTVPAQTIYALTAAQLAQATFVPGVAGTFDDIFVQAFDGKSYSGWNAGVHVTATPPNNAPTVSLPAGGSVGASAGQTLQLSSLFSGSDIDGDTLSYYVYDASPAADGGHVEIDGSVVAAQTITAMTAAQLAQATFGAGDAGTTDDIYVQAFDGHAYSGWNSSVHIFV